MVAGPRAALLVGIPGLWYLDEVQHLDKRDGRLTLGATARHPAAGDRHPGVGSQVGGFEHLDPRRDGVGGAVRRLSQPLSRSNPYLPALPFSSALRQSITPRIEHIHPIGYEAFSASINAQRSPTVASWRRRPLLYLGTRFPSAACGSHLPSQPRGHAPQDSRPSQARGYLPSTDSPSYPGCPR